MSGYVIAVDQGTTSTRAIVFDEKMKTVGVGQREFKQYFPRSGWVEHDANEIWASVVTTMRDAIKAGAIDPKSLGALGITNQRETVVVWDRTTGEPIYNAIVWQDRRTTPLCERLKSDGLEHLITQKTGLLLDPYFSATKLAWILDNVEGARQRANIGALAFGTIDSWLIWKLTNGKSHVTDATNAARTMLFDISSNCWDDELLKLLRIPKSMLAQVKDCADDFGTCDPEILGVALPILGVAGDQHAASLGNACFKPGMLKSTYGTGCFALLNTGDQRVTSKNRMLTTLAYRLNGKSTYALEGSIFVAGAGVQWLRDGLGIIDEADQSGRLALNADVTQQLYLVPAFTGLGAPHWDANARGALYGLTRNSGPAEIAAATLESVAYQTNDLLSAMHDDWGQDDKDTVLRVDGGMVASNWTMQCLANILNAPVDRPQILETTALGAAWLAGHRASIWPDQEEFSKSWALERRFEPQMASDVRGSKIAGWRDAVRRTLSTQ